MKFILIHFVLDYFNSFFLNVCLKWQVSVTLNYKTTLNRVKPYSFAENYFDKDLIKTEEQKKQLGQLCKVDQSNPNRAISDIELLQRNLAVS